MREKGTTRLQVLELHPADTGRQLLAVSSARVGEFRAFTNLPNLGPGHGLLAR